MTEAEQIAADILQFVVGRVNVTTGTREDIANFIEGKVSRYMPAQAQLIFDARDHKGQREAIVKSLKAARSTGLMTDEIARLGGFNHTARISELRKLGYRIQVEPIKGTRNYLYRIGAESYEFKGGQ